MKAVVRREVRERGESIPAISGDGDPAYLGPETELSEVIQPDELDDGLYNVIGKVNRKPYFAQSSDLDFVEAPAPKQKIILSVGRIHEGIIELESVLPEGIEVEIRDYDAVMSYGDEAGHAVGVDENDEAFVVTELMDGRFVLKK